MSNPDLRKVAKNWTEREYRARPELSYSQIAKYAREGFDGYIHLNDEIETESLKFGSALDTLITDGINAFEQKYCVINNRSVTGKRLQILHILVLSDSITRNRIEDVSVRAWALAFEKTEFYPNRDFNSKMNYFRSVDGNFLPDVQMTYIDILNSRNKTMLTSEQYSDVMNAKSALMSHKAISKLFANSPFDNLDRYFQLKFSERFNGVSYRCMADLLVVKHDTKEIFPVDLKTSSKNEYDFYKSFITWRYDIQARLYWQIINANLKHSKEFREYKLRNYLFAVVNARTLMPMLWEMKTTKSMDTLVFGRNKDIICEHPFKIGEELYSLVNTKAKVPKGISTTNINTLEDFLNNM